MKIEIDTEVISKLGISINEFCLLYLLYNDCKDSIEVTTQMILKLESLGFIKDQSEGIILRKKAIDLFKNETIPNKQKDLEEFVDKYRALFPAGVKSGNRLVKGDKLGCLSKLKAFKLKYPEYTQEDILEATKTYIDVCRKRNYDKMTSADYLIEKDKISMLASYIEDIKIRGNQNTSENSGIGKTKSI